MPCVPIMFEILNQMRIDAKIRSTISNRGTEKFSRFLSLFLKKKKRQQIPLHTKSQNQIWNIYITSRWFGFAFALAVTSHCYCSQCSFSWYNFHLLSTTASKFHIRDIRWLLVSRFLIFIDLYDLLAGCWWCLFRSRLLI